MAKLKFSRIKDCWISMFWILYLFNFLCWSMCLVAQSYLTLCDPMDYTHQASLSMEILQQEFWRGLLCPPTGDLPNRRIKPRSPKLQADSLPSELPGKPLIIHKFYVIYWNADTNKFNVGYGRRRKNYFDKIPFKATYAIIA